MEQLATVLARAGRALLSLLPVEVAIGFASLIAVAALVRAARAIPLNSAFARGGGRHPATGRSRKGWRSTASTDRARPVDAAQAKDLRRT